MAQNTQGRYSGGPEGLPLCLQDPSLQSFPPPPAPSNSETPPSSYSKGDSCQRRAQGRLAPSFVHTPKAIYNKKQSWPTELVIGPGCPPVMSPIFVSSVLSVSKCDSHGINPNASFSFLGNSWSPLSTPGVLIPSNKAGTWKTSSSPWTSKRCSFLKPFLSVHRSLLLKSPFYYLAWFKKKDKSKFPPNYNSSEGCSKFPMSARNTNRPYNH